MPGTAAAQAGCENADATPRSIGIGKAERAVRCLVNNRRAKANRKTLKNRKQLANAADRHSRFMRDNHCFAHTCDKEAPLATRLRSSQYLPCGCSYGYGEAISWSRATSATPRKTVNGWMKSDIHRKIIMNRKFREIGIGIVWGSPFDAADDAAIFTADLGYRRR